jgi:hypothetical protein
MGGVGEGDAIDNYQHKLKHILRIRKTLKSGRICWFFYIMIMITTTTAAPTHPLRFRKSQGEGWGPPIIHHNPSHNPSHVYLLDIQAMW